MTTDYKKDIEIDKHSLDTEWERHTVLFAQWAEQSVEAQYERDRAKERLDLVRAEVDSDIRRQAVDAGEKITEAGVQAKILQNSDYQSASGAYIEAVRAAKILDVARDSFDHRRKALEKLTDLYLTGYWIEPRIASIKKQEVQNDNDAAARAAFKRRAPRK